MSYDKESRLQRRATALHVIKKRQAMATRYGATYTAGSGVFRKRRVFACSCVMCRRMSYWEHTTRHQTPQAIRASDSARVGLSEI